MKTLSLVVPVYQTRDYLCRCLDSVLVPEVLDELELIVVNDGSRDGSDEIIRRYQRRYPGTLVSIDKENGGHGSTINAGLALASGRYFRVLDSDDWFDTPAFIRMMLRLKDRREDLIVTPYTREYTETGASLCYDYPQWQEGRSYRADALSLSPDGSYVCMASATFRTALLRACRLHLTENSYYVDMQYLLFPIPFLESFCLIRESVYRYAIGRASQSVSRKSMLNRLSQHERILCSLIEYYASFCASLDPSRRRYMTAVIAQMYYTHLSLVRSADAGRMRAVLGFRKLERRAHERAPELYQKVGAFAYLRVSRRLHYLNLLFFRRLFRLLSVLGSHLIRLRGPA